MRFFARFATVFAGWLLISSGAYPQATTPRAAFSGRFSGTGTGPYSPQTPGQYAARASVVVVGKVVEVEKGTVEVLPYRGAPTGRKVAYKIAIVKIDDRLIGGSGLTQFRVGFPADTATSLPAMPGRGSTILTPGQEGCFFLNSHPNGDFYVLAYGGPLDIKSKNYAKEIEEVKKVAKIIDDPVAALKSKELDDRFQAASVILQRYRINHSGRVASREPIPPDENKLIVALLAELPWQAKATKPRPAESGPAPCRSTLWYMIQSDLTGFRQPEIAPGTSPADRIKIMDEATAAYLKDNGGKIKIKGFTK